jgi:hypothetical protein
MDNPIEKAVFTLTITLVDGSKQGLDIEGTMKADLEKIDPQLFKRFNELCGEVIKATAAITNSIGRAEGLELEGECFPADLRELFLPPREDWPEHIGD